MRTDSSEVETFREKAAAIWFSRPQVDITGQTAADSDSVFQPLPASDGVHIFAASRLNALCSQIPSRYASGYDSRMSNGGATKQKELAEVKPTGQESYCYLSQRRISIKYGDRGHSFAGSTSCFVPHRRVCQKVTLQGLWQ
jgi:hypothetical protein